MYIYIYIYIYIYTEDIENFVILQFLQMFYGHRTNGKPKYVASCKCLVVKCIYSGIYILT